MDEWRQIEQERMQLERAQAQLNADERRRRWQR